MKPKIAYTVFTTSDSGLDYIVKGNFGDDKAAADKWMEENDDCVRFPNGLFVKQVKY